MTLSETTGWLAVGVGIALLALALTIAYRIITGSIDVNSLLKDGVSGEASTARFQLLVFTFAIAFSYVIFLLNVASKCTALPCAMPEVPWSLLSLLGVSAATYAAGKKLDETAPPSEPNKPKPDDAKG
jgi:hypothetical protein